MRSLPLYRTAPPVVALLCGLLMACSIPMVGMSLAALAVGYKRLALAVLLGSPPLRRQLQNASPLPPLSRICPYLPAGAFPQDIDPLGGVSKDIWR
jgi:hypothetical protein